MRQICGGCCYPGPTTIVKNMDETEGERQRRGVDVSCRVVITDSLVLLGEGGKENKGRMVGDG